MNEDVKQKMFDCINSKLSESTFFNFVSWVYDPGEQDFVDLMKEVKLTQKDRRDLAKTLGETIDLYAYSKTNRLYSTAIGILETYCSTNDSIISRMQKLNADIDGMGESNDKTNMELIFSKMVLIANLEDSFPSAQKYRDGFAAKSVKNLFSPSAFIKWIGSCANSFASYFFREEQVSLEEMNDTVDDKLNLTARFFASTVTNKSYYELAFEGANKLTKPKAGKVILASMLPKLIADGTWGAFCQKQEDLKKELIKAGYDEDVVDERIEMEGQDDIEYKGSAEEAMRKLFKHISFLEKEINIIGNSVARENANREIRQIKKELCNIKMPQKVGCSVVDDSRNEQTIVNIKRSIDNLGIVKESKHGGGYMHNSKTITERFDDLTEAKMTQQTKLKKSEGIRKAKEYLNETWDSVNGALKTDTKPPTMRF